MERGRRLGAVCRDPRVDLRCVRVLRRLLAREQRGEECTQREDIPGARRARVDRVELGREPTARTIGGELKESEALNTRDELPPARLDVQAPGRERSVGERLGEAVRGGERLTDLIEQRACVRDAWRDGVGVRRELHGEALAAERRVDDRERAVVEGCIEDAADVTV